MAQLSQNAKFQSKGKRNVWWLMVNTYREELDNAVGWEKICIKLPLLQMLPPSWQPQFIWDAINMHNYANQAVIKCQFIRDLFFVCNENEAQCSWVLCFSCLSLLKILLKRGTHISSSGSFAVWWNVSQPITDTHHESSFESNHKLSGRLWPSDIDVWILSGTQTGVIMPLLRMNF